MGTVDLLDGSQSRQIPLSHHPSEFKTEYHPHSGRLLLHQSYKQFRASKTIVTPQDKTPWSPFHGSGDFEFAEVALDAGLNAAQVNKLLTLISHVATGSTNVT